nr:hypothetical protein [Sporomusa malonica]
MSIDELQRLSKPTERISTLQYQRNLLSGIYEQSYSIFASTADAREALDYCLKGDRSDGDPIEPSLKSSEGPRKLIFNTLLFKLSLLRVVCDYIAGMTDSYAEEEYRKLYVIAPDILG